MSDSPFDKFFIPIFVIFIIVIGGVWIVKTIYDMKHPEARQVIFNVTGVVNATNSSAICIHYECIKYCIDHIEDGTGAQYRCYDECAKLGGCS